MDTAVYFKFAVKCIRLKISKSLHIAEMLTNKNQKYGLFLRYH